MPCLPQIPQMIQLILIPKQTTDIPCRWRNTTIHPTKITDPHTQVVRMCSHIQEDLGFLASLMMNRRSLNSTMAAKNADIAMSNMTTSTAPTTFQRLPHMYLCSTRQQ